MTLLAWIPAALTGILLAFVLGVDLSQFVPTYSDVYNDSFYHWRQVYTFSAVGFNGGYYTLNELPAQATFTHFYAHGPAFALLYGLIGRLFGWSLTAPIIVNAVVITLALFALLLMLRPRGWMAALLCLASIAVMPVLIYIPTGMTESLNLAGAILVAGLVVRLLNERAALPRRWYGGLLLLLTVLALLRPTWGIVFLPVLLLRLKTVTPLRVVLAGGIGIALCAALYALNAYLSSPYPLLEQSLTSALQTRLDRLNENLNIWNRGIDIEVAQRYSVVGVLAAIGVGWLVQRRRFSPEAIFHLGNLGAALLLNLFFNDMSFYRDFRALAPHFLLSLLVLAACRRWLIPALFIIVQAVMLPSFLKEYRATVEPQFTPGLVEQITAFRDQTREALVHDPAAPSAWCNTLLFIMENRGDRVLSIPPELALIDPGIGLSFTIGYWGETAPLTYPIRSRYLLLSERNRALIREEAQLTLLVNTGAGGVYRNEDVEC
jgi:hypothetical protein